LVRPVSMQPVVSHADAQASTHPIEKERDAKCMPIE
jgi:hypothetical protein